MHRSTQFQQWFALAVVSGREKSISRQIEDRLDRAGIEQRTIEIFCPDQEVVLEKAGGERTTVRKVTMPGYLLIRGRHISPQAFMVMRRVNGVLGFLGGDEHPTPLGASEVDKMLGLAQDHKQHSRRQAAWTVGEEVRIVDGPLSDFVGTIKDINDKAGTATVEIEIFGRATPSTVPFAQLRKAS